MLRWLSSRRPARVPDQLWEQVFDSLPFVRRFDHPGRARLRDLCMQFLDSKSMTGAGGLDLTAPLQLSVALQACVPILELGLHWYRGWDGIVLYPSEFQVRRRIEDEHGLVQEFDDTLSGESWHGGPVILSWNPGAQAPADGAAPQASWGSAFNVVIHEFAHKLDQLAAPECGRPPFDRRLHSGLSPHEWDEARNDAFERLNAAIDLAEAAVPGNIDPESPDADAYFANLPLDPYAAQDPAEFFAVSSEAFFVDPLRLSQAFPRWYSMLAAFYRQDPLQV
jgi:Mlc titration factor MtfA (ptsG expression regulator)